MADTNTVVEALARHLDTLGLARFSENGIYPAGPLPAIFTGRQPDKPDQCITVNVYDQQTTWGAMGSPTFWVQLRYRMGPDPRQTEALADNVYAALHEQSNVTWAGLHVLHCTRTVRAPIGADANNRYERADSYRLVLNP